jgi:hypothetical protein
MEVEHCGRCRLKCGRMAAMVRETKIGPRLMSWLRVSLYKRAGASGDGFESPVCLKERRWRLWYPRCHSSVCALLDCKQPSMAHLNTGWMDVNDFVRVKSTGRMLAPTPSWNPNPTQSHVLTGVSKARRKPPPVTPLPPTFTPTATVVPARTIDGIPNMMNTWNTADAEKRPAYGIRSAGAVCS